MWSAIIGGLAGLVTGAVGSLVAPWVALKVEHQRQVHADRRQRVAEWRAGLASVEANLTPGRNPFIQGAFVGEPWFATLRPHLDPATVNGWESPGARYIHFNEAGSRRDGVAMQLADEIDRIAREWDVV